MHTKSVFHLKSKTTCSIYNVQDEKVLITINIEKEKRIIFNQFNKDISKNLT